MNIGQDWESRAAGFSHFAKAHPASNDGGIAFGADITVCDLDAAESVWRQLEDRTVVTPYQRFDWCKALVESGVETGKVSVAIIRSHSKPVALLPMVIKRRWGIKRGMLLGSDVANTDALICDPEVFATLDHRSFTALFTSISRVLGGLDVVSFRNFRSTQAGVPNPLNLLDAQLSPSRLYVAEINMLARPFLERGVSTKLRQNLKRGMRRLEESFGPVRLETISDSIAFNEVHATFLAQRGERFAKMGVRNIFAKPAMVNFFTLACQQGFMQEKPVMICHALFAGDTIIGTSFGTQHGTHYSQYINSTSSGPASKYSLMGILVALMMDDLFSRGVTVFDLGLGDFPYKTDWTQPETVFDATIPLTARGRLAVGIIRAATRAKRLVKQNEMLWNAAKSVRRLVYFISPGGRQTFPQGK